MKRPEMLIVSETGSEPVSVSEAKAYALIDTTADDTEIGYLITSARRMIESFLNKDILAKNRKLYIPFVTDGIMQLYYAPVDTINSVTVGTTAYTSDQYDVYGVLNGTNMVNQLMSANRTCKIPDIPMVVAKWEKRGRHIESDAQGVRRRGGTFEACHP